MSQAVATEADGRRALPIEADRCSIVGALEALGDAWSVLVLRELFFGVHRFNDIQHDLGISRSVLADRLERLADQGIIRAVPYREPGARVRHEYRLTRKGVGLQPLMVALMQWGDHYVNDGDRPVELIDAVTGEQVLLELRSTSGRKVEAHEVRPRPTTRAIT